MEPDKKIPAILSWSGGKDSALTLYRVLQTGKYAIKALHTTLNGVDKHVAMHGIPESLIEAQASATGIPVIKDFLYESSNKSYERTLKERYSSFVQQGVRTIIFGDIYLEDIRQYREHLLYGTELSGKFPLWGENTHTLMQEFLSLGFKSVICSLDAGKLPGQYTGQVITPEMVRNFPGEVDPCGEKGEFHTFCFDGPVFRHPVLYRLGKSFSKSYPAPTEANENTDGNQALKFWFCEIMPD